jgi:AsmA-like C-terminal region
MYGVKRWLTRGSVRVTIVALLILLLAGAAGVYLVARRALGSELLRAQLEQELTARLGRPVRIATATARVFPGLAIDLGDVAVGQPPTLQLARIRVFTGLRALFGDAIDIRRIDVSNGRPGGAGSPVAFDLEASLLGDRLDVRSLTVRGPTTTIEARGVMTSIANVEGTFEARAGVLDLSELVAMVAAVAPPSSPSRQARATPMHLSVKLSAPTLRFDVDRFQDLSTAIDATPGRVVMDALSLKLFGGAFKGRLDADTRAAAPLLRLNGTLADLDVADLLKRTGSAGGITGRLSGPVALTAQGNSGDALLGTARGTMTATVKNGNLPHLDMVRTVVLAFGKPAGDAKGSGTAFDTLGGTFTLSSGTLRSDNLSLRSRDVDSDGRGTLAIESGQVSARADVVLSPQLTAQAGTDLRRYAEEDGRVVVPATVSGTLGRPSMFIDVAAAARRAFQNEVKRRATDFLGGLFKKKKGGGGGQPDRR